MTVITTGQPSYTQVDYTWPWFVQRYYFLVGELVSQQLVSEQSLGNLTQCFCFYLQSIVCGPTSLSFEQIPPIFTSDFRTVTFFVFVLFVLKGSRVRYKKINYPGYRWRLDRFIIERGQIIGVTLCSAEHASFLTNLLKRFFKRIFRCSSVETV